MITVIKTWKYKVGYHVRYEELSGDDAGGGKTFVMRTAYTPNGAYIGSPRWAKRLSDRGIVPELATPKNNVCSVGFCKKDGKWNGWSHRAIVAFGIGDKLFEEYWPEATEHTPFVEHGAITIEQLKQARQAAVNFAEYVS